MKVICIQHLSKKKKLLHNKYNKKKYKIAPKKKLFTNSYSLMKKKEEKTLKNTKI